MSDARRALLARIEADQDRLVRFFQEFTRIDTSNPPGDTRAGAAFIQDFLGAAALPHRIIAPQEAMPNILASTRFARPGRHLVLNGHIQGIPVPEPRDVRRVAVAISAAAAHRGWSYTVSSTRLPSGSRK